MFQRLTRYAAALLAFGTACAIYQFSFVAWLEPEPVEPIEFAQTPGLRRNEALASLFPPDAWQVQHCKRLQTRDGVLLFENWQQIGDDQWKLWPLTLVMGITSESPLILDAREGAEIKFSESLDMMSGGAPPIERGRMIGSVRIKSVGKAITLGEPGADNAAAPQGHLEIVSSDFGIDFRKIWTTQPILVQLGDVKLVGRDLTLHLAPMGHIRPGSEGAMSILDRMELIYLDELTVPLPEGGLWGSAAGKLAASAPNVAAQARPAVAQRLPSPTAAAAPPALAKLRCAGRVVFLFGTHELMLTDRVQLEHRTQHATDRFECNELRMQFADLLHARPHSEGNARADEIGDYLLSVVAEGKPARMLLPSFAAEISAESINFDARSGLLQLSGSAGARITYAGHSWRFSEFVYQLNPSDPTQIGSFEAAGSGIVEFAGATQLPVKRLRWTDGIKLDQPVENDEFSLRIDGDVTALMSDDGEFTCDSALLVLQGGSREGHGDDWLQETRPKRFQASGQVAMHSPMVNVATRLLQIYFDFDPPAARPLHGSTALSAGPADVAAHPIRQWVRQSDNASAPPDHGTAAVPAASSTPVQTRRPTITGNTINARLKLSGTELTATDLSVVGNVTVRHTLDTPRGELQAVLNGDRLQMRDAQGDEILQIGSGIDSPARLALGDGFFIGPMIQIRLADNIVWIKDAGEFRLPSQILPQSMAFGSSGKPATAPLHAAERSSAAPLASGERVRWVSPPHCRWRGQMLFNGTRAVLTDGIDIRGAAMVGDQQDVWDIDLVGDQVEVIFEPHVTMRQIESAREAEVDHIRITSSKLHPLVVTANQLTPRGVRKARHILAVPELTLRPQIGTLSGLGPGWYRAWVKNEDTPLSAGVSSGGFRSVDTAMFGLHLVYEESLQANLNQQSLDFNRNVQIAARPVKAWDDIVDVQAMQGLRMSESLLECDRLRLGIDQTQPRGFLGSAWELEATGGVLFQTRNEKGLFSGNAHRAAYTAAKDIFLIEGEPGRSATMNQTLPTGVSGGTAMVKQMSVNTRTMEVLHIEFDRVQLGTLPPLSR